MFWGRIELLAQVYIRLKTQVYMELLALELLKPLEPKLLLVLVLAPIELLVLVLTSIELLVLEQMVLFKTQA